MAGLTNKEQSEYTKARLWDALFALVNENDIENLTISKICTKAGVSNRTFYLYFEDKEAAILECYLTQQQQVWENHLKKYPFGSDPLENLLSIFRFQFEVLVWQPILAQLVFRCMLNGSGQKPRKDLFVYDKIVETVAECQCSGAISQRFTADEIGAKLYAFSRGLQFEYLTVADIGLNAAVMVERIKEYMTCFQ